MKLVTFADERGMRIGALAADRTIVDFDHALPNAPRSMVELIGAGREGLAAVGQALATGKGRVAADKVTLCAPIPRPAKNILCVGRNYHEHAHEFHASGFDATAGKDAVPEVPIIFTKWPNAVIGPGESIPSFLDPTGSVDYEGELAVVIGKSGRGIARADAYAHVYGYTIVNDVTARTLQHRHKQWFLGKSLDGFCPMGPCIVTADEVPDVSRLRLQTRVNGELRQDALVSQLIFDVPALIECISQLMTLEPGDLIATGTCAGVGIGFNPPKFLRKGDRVAITIEPIGTLENPVA